MRYKTHNCFGEELTTIVHQVKLLLKTPDLSMLNEVHEELFKVGNDSITSFHDAVYNKYRAGWTEVSDAYDNLIKKVVAPLINEEFLYQKQPTWRFHLPNNIAVGAFHKDSDFNHPIGEINFVLPLTNSEDTASIWVESEVDKGDYEPMSMKLGELIEFNGNQLTHGNKVNLTGKTRVSLDFRILPLSKYKPEENKESVTKKTKFVEGGYYTLFKH